MANPVDIVNTYFTEYNKVTLQWDPDVGIIKGVEDIADTPLVRWEIPVAAIAPVLQRLMVLYDAFPYTVAPRPDGENAQECCGG